MAEALFAGAVERSYAVGTVELYQQRVYNHSNGVVLVGLAPSHPALQPPRRVTAVRFDGGKRDLSKSEVKGKRKRGGAFMGNHDRLCEVECDDGTSYTLRACVRGSLVEVNERLVQNPQLLHGPLADAFVAVLIPKEADRITGDKAIIQERLLERIASDRIQREAQLAREKQHREERHAARSARAPAAAAAAPAAETAGSQEAAANGSAS